MFSLLTLVLSIFALSFLIFIHELGHYFMARRVGMKVEVFSIGFGRPLFSWMKNGVKWQLGWLPFGGYVKIAGTDTDKNQDPYKIKDGFFGKGPWARIKVAFMGPLVNLVFALIAFALLYAVGGREKSYSEFTKKIGFIDSKSELWAHGIRPGDEITQYNSNPFQGAKDHVYAPMTSKDNVDVRGFMINYWTKEKTPFHVSVPAYSHPFFADKGIMTAGILQPASYIIYDRLPSGKENPLPEGSPLAGSGIEYGDRLVWVDGHLVFSVAQLSDILNDDRALLTIERGDQTLLVRVPRVEVQEFKLDPEFREELIDWQYEADLKGSKIQKLMMIPYNLTNDGVVESRVKFIDKDKEELFFPLHANSNMENPLFPRDKIIAVDGVNVKSSHQILNKLQSRRVNIIVERNGVKNVFNMKAADDAFDKRFEPADLKKISSTIGTNKVTSEAGPYVLLKGVVLKTRGDVLLSPEKQALVKNELAAEKRQVEEIEDPEKRALALERLEARSKQLVLGLPMIQDARIEYNPGALEMFENVTMDIYRTLSALVNGSLNVKWLSGPVGIVQVVHDQGMQGLNEILFWMGAISLNLGILNLLPIPMLDGGMIVFSFFELLTGRKIKPKTMEKLILPFAILLILFFIFVTFNDINRIFGGILKW